MRASWFGAVVITAIAALLLLWISRRERQPQLDPAAVLVRVQQLNQLATVKYTIQKVVGIRDQHYPVGSESILLIMQANVEAGVDLARLHSGDVTGSADTTIVVRLPEPKILNVIVDEKETKVWDRQKTWWTPWIPYSLDLEQRARIAGVAGARQAALDLGILGQAEHNAETSIQSLLALAGVKAVRFVPFKTT